MPPHLRVVKELARNKKAAIDAGARVTGSIPEPPAFLSDDARAEWHRVAPGLQALRLLTDLDVATFGAYCSAFGTWKQATELLNAQELTTETQHGNLIQNPLLGIANRARSEAIKFATELGLTPTSRARLKVPDLPLPGDPASRFFPEG